MQSKTGGCHARSRGKKVSIPADIPRDWAEGSCTGKQGEVKANGHKLVPWGGGAFNKGGRFASKKTQCLRKY